MRRFALKKKGENLYFVLEAFVISVQTRPLQTVLSSSLAMSAEGDTKQRRRSSSDASDKNDLKDMLGRKSKQDKKKADPNALPPVPATQMVSQSLLTCCVLGTCCVGHSYKKIFIIL